MAEKRDGMESGDEKENGDGKESGDGKACNEIIQRMRYRVGKGDGVVV